MTKTFPTFRSLLLAALCPVLAMAIAGCGSKKTDEANEFPPSITAPSETVGKTSTLPVEPELPPVSEVITEPVVETPVPVVMPTTYKGFVAEGKRLFAAGDFADSLTMFTKASDAKPYAYPRIQMARALLAMEMFETARTHAEAAVDLDENSGFAWNTLGRVELAAGDLEAAVTSFERATEADEHNSYAWNNLGFTLLEQERYQEAAEALESATSAGTPKAYMWNNLGMAYEHLNLIAEARAAYRQAADLGSDKAAASVTRLEGVESLVIPEKDAEGEESIQKDDEVDGDAKDLNDGIPHNGAVDIEADETDELDDEMLGC